MSSRLDSDITLNTRFCPMCHCGRFCEHPMSEYSREWNKCSSCGYMESKAITKARVLNVLAPEQLTEIFIDPILKIVEDTINVCSKCKKIKSDNCCSCQSKSPSNN